MDENENIGFEDFESALFAEDYQTDSADETEAEETASHSDEGTDSEAAEAPESEENSEGENTSETEEVGAEEAAEGDDGTTEQMFTIKVNKEERQITLEEMTALAQKGADYDRVKDQAKNQQNTIQELQARLTGLTEKQGVLDVLEVIAQKSGNSIDQLAETLYVNFRKSAGASAETAKEELKSARLEKELNAVKAQQTKQQEEKQDGEARAQKDLEDFRKEYPDVTLDEKIVDALEADLRNGMSLVSAYRKYEKSQDAKRIEELERKLAAKEQNSKNKRTSPGSQQDSGGRRSRSDFEEFEKALFG